MSKTQISIVICTYNRANLLRGALQSILEAHPSDQLCEIIIVDNNSTDATPDTVKEFLLTNPSLRYVLETNLGLSSARNRGWQEARGEYVGYLDDDCVVSPDWLMNALYVATEVRPEAFGGPYYAFYNTLKPHWFKDEYGSHEQGTQARFLQPNEYLDGGNMFIRRQLLQSLGGFQPALGMTGTKIAYGEETYFFDQVRAIDSQARLYYAPEIFVYHLVRAEKMKLSTVPVRFLALGRYSAQILDQPVRRSWARSLSVILRAIAKLIKACTWDALNRNRVKYPAVENYLYEYGFQGFIDLGEHLEILAQSLGLRKRV